MKILPRNLLATLTTLATVCASTNVFAGNPLGGMLAYGPGSGSAAIPTLGGGALIALALLLAVVAFRVMRSQQYKGVNLVVALTALTAIASGVGGIDLVSKAWAPPYENMVNMSSPDGGTVALVPGPNQVNNTTDVPQNIQSIETEPGCNIDGGPNGGGNGGGPQVRTNGGGNGGGSVGQCSDSPSTTVPPGDYCTIFLFCGEPD